MKSWMLEAGLSSGGAIVSGAAVMKKLEGHNKCLDLWWMYFMWILASFVISCMCFYFVWDGCWVNKSPFCINLFVSLSVVLLVFC